MPGKAEIVLETESEVISMNAKVFKSLRISPNFKSRIINKQRFSLAT